MGDAQQGNFIEGGTIDPFTGLAPALTPEEEQRRLEARQAELRAAATRTANINNAPGGYNSQRAAGDQEILDSSNKLAAAHRAANPRHTLFGALIRDPVTMGIVTAPYAVLGAGAALGGLAAGGAGSLVGEGGAAAGPGMAFADTSTAGAEAVMNAAHVPAAVAGGAAAGPSLGGMIGADLAAAAPSVLPAAAMVAAPYLINELTSGKTKEEKALLAKQNQMAQEAKVRQGQQQDARMNALGQQLLAFNPRNQMMAQMFGPQAAFTPEAMAQMAQGQAPAHDPTLDNYTGNDQGTLQRKREQMRRQAEYDKAEAARREMILNGIQQPGPGPAPIQMPTPQPARRY